MADVFATDVSSAELGRHMELVGFVSARRDYAAFTYLQIQDVSGSADVRMELPGAQERHRGLGRCCAQ